MKPEVRKSTEADAKKAMKEMNEIVTKEAQKAGEAAWNFNVDMNADTEAAMVTI